MVSALVWSNYNNKIVKLIKCLIINLSLPLILTYTSRRTSPCLSDFEERDVSFPREKKIFELKLTVSKLICITMLL